MKFETLEINQCLNKECNQKFTMDNIKLAVWLHGVIFLSQEHRPTGDDPLLPSLSVPDEQVERFDPQGYVGLTCPKCLETRLYKATYQDVREFKKMLQSMVTLSGSDPNERSCQLQQNLRYYAPFGIKPGNYERFDIMSYQFEHPEFDFEYFQCDLRMYVAGEIPDDWIRLCSYIDILQDVPAGAETYIHWFKENQLFDILKFEKEHDCRILPRYHYITDLVRKIDSLQIYNHQNHWKIGELKCQYKYQEAKRHEEFLKNVDAHEKFEPQNFDDLLEKWQNSITNKPKLNADFFETLICEPVTLKDTSYLPAPALHCNYLWSEINPFWGKEFPEIFPTDIDVGLPQKDLGLHKEMVGRIQENFTKQYTQEFLRENIVDFLEEYENLIQGNAFSYAHVWQLKESYLEGLYKGVINGLSEEAPYVMKREGKAWKLVFNGKTLSGLRQIGFSYLYHLICYPNEHFFHADLFIAAGKGLPVKKPKNNPGSKGTKNVEDVGDNGEPVARMIDDKGLKTLFDRIKKLKAEIAEANEFGHNEKALIKEDELQETRKFLSQVYDKKKKKIRYIKDGNLKKVTDSVGKAIFRALEDIREEDPNAYQHFANAIGIKNLYQDGLVYRPAPDEKIEWITIG